MKHVLILVFATMISATAHGQSEANPKKSTFGFSLGVLQSNFQNSNTIPGLDAGGIKNMVGYRLGLTMDREINSQFTLAPKIDLAVNQGYLDAEVDGEFTPYTPVGSTIDFMLHGTLNTSCSNDRLYVLFGPNFRYALDDTKFSSTEIDVPNDFALDFGIGMRNKLKSFTFAPELRYTIGTTNVSQLVMWQRVYNHTISLIFSFKD
ncbi:MAG: outer membrane beta-barrel protein [Cryomorphaceae bacterium]|nr:outer membrane beta-barrel protein [Cryomorphaceae bacterium]